MIRHFTASGIVLTDDDHVLLVEHRKLGWWLYPGGHVEPDEDPAQAVLREVAEETGITCDIIAEDRFAYPGVTVLPSPFTICVQDIPKDASTGPHQHIDMVYILSPRNGQFTPQTAEVSKCAWVPVSEVAALATPPELPDLIIRAATYARTLKVSARP